MPNELEIVINRKPKASASKKVRRSNSGSPSIDEKTGRRRLKKKGIQFYDLAQIKIDGNWITKDIAFPATISINGYGLPTEPSFDISSLPIEYLESVVDDLVDLPNLSSAHRIIPKNVGRAFPIFVDGTDVNEEYFFHDMLNLEDESWTDSGLILTTEQLQGKISITPQNNHFLPVSIGFGDTKITSVRDYEEDPVTFNPTNSDVYYLMPAIGASQGQSKKIAIPTTKVLLNGIYRFKPRDFSNPSANFEGNFQSSEAIFTEASNRMKALPGTRTYTLIMHHNSPFEHQLTSGGAFPTAGMVEGFVSYLSGDSRQSENGTLLAIIQQGSQKYYVWLDIH